jgi:FkbM family methyltransferase
VKAGIERVVNGDPIRLLAPFANAEPLRDDWEANLYARFKEAVLPGMTVLDVGASFGLYSIAAGRLGARVFAFEPAGRTAAALAVHLRLNGVADRVEPVAAAAAERSGRADFWEQETSFLASLVESAPRTEQDRFAEPVISRSIATVALDDFCRERALDPAVVKVDVEGAEAAVLRGARELLGRRRAMLFLEVHHELLERSGGSAEEVFAELNAAGWSWEEIEDSSPPGTAHYVCAPRQSTLRIAAK